MNPAIDNPADIGLPCVHCGLCLDHCPTYRQLGTEADSPRGRIYLMEAITAGQLSLDDEAAAHLDGCLGCLACESACPSGVDFGRRIETFRPLISAPRHRPLKALWKTLVLVLTTNRPLMAAALATARALDRMGLGHLRRRLPGLSLMPRNGNDLAPTLPARPVATAAKRPRVVLLEGCVAPLLRPQTNQAAVEVLRRNGFDVLEVPAQGCCGALALHGGRKKEARALARKNIEVLGGADFVVSTSAGCGAMLKDYDRLFADDPDDGLSAAAAALSARTRDICELLFEEGFERPRPLANTNGPVLYHDACHLVHAQGISQAPRALVEAATGSAVEDLGDNQICCGSAGSYNLDHPAMAERLGADKARLAEGKDAGSVAVANLGCLLQLERAFALQGLAIEVTHPIELLASAYRDESGGDGKERPSRNSTGTVNS
ncbi:MAG: heterodisulfide reductase-related iron-sulfur binding cluster [Deltaproteobacteria bacterium]